MSERTSAYTAQNIENPYSIFFEEYIPVNNITNLCISYAENPVATLYHFHGLWGSPIEDWIRNTFQILLDNKINIVSIETVPLSLTTKQNVKSENYLETLRTSIESSLSACKEIEKLNNVQYNIANPHSMACRALLDLMFEKPNICQKFNKTIFNNAYFIPPEMLYSLSNSKLWDRLKSIPGKKRNIINNIEYDTTTIPEHLFITPKDKRMQRAQDADDLKLLIKMIMARIFKLNPNLQVNFIQGTGDKATIYRNQKIFEHLENYKNTQIEFIPDANHTFNNALKEYVLGFKKIIDSSNLNVAQKSA